MMKKNYRDDLLSEKRRHEEFVQQQRLEMDKDLQMRNQLEFERNQRMLDDLKLQQETKRYFNNHFDNIEKAKCGR